MSEQEVRNLIGEFTWDFGNCFFIETMKGNFLYRSPSYGGDGVVRRTSKTLDDYLSGNHGRCKGTHFIADFCGEQVPVEL